MGSCATLNYIVLSIYYNPSVILTLVIFVPDFFDFWCECSFFSLHTFPS